MIGVKIGEKNTLSEWGLILCSDLVVGAPPVKTNWVDVPAADGALNFSYDLAGRALYKTRTISFRLFCNGSKGDFDSVAADFAQYCHGKMLKLWLPTDDTHYFKGIFEIDNLQSGYNKNILKIKVTAEPYRYKNDITTQEITIGADGTAEVTLTNEMRWISPVFMLLSGDVAVETLENSHALQDEPMVFDDVQLSEGNNVLYFSGTAGSKAMVEYQEARI